MNVPKDGQRGMSMVFGDMSKNLNGQLSDYRYFSVILVSIGCISHVAILDISSQVYSKFLLDVAVAVSHVMHVLQTMKNLQDSVVR